MSSAKFSSLFEYNAELFQELRNKSSHLQLGFFAGNDVLFIGQNPGRQYNARTTLLTEHVSEKGTWAESQLAYRKMMRATLMGKYITGIVKDWNTISFTNVVKEATPNNTVPSHEQYEFYFPILMKQIDLLQPKVIACLGKYAGSVFGLEESYYARRYKSSVVIMYPHPSYIMRQGMNKIINEQARMTVSIEEMIRWSEAANLEHETTKQL